LPDRLLSKSKYGGIVLHQIARLLPFLLERHVSLPSLLLKLMRASPTAQ